MIFCHKNEKEITLGADSAQENRGKRHHAVSEALGSLPLNIVGPDIQAYSTDFCLISFDSCLAAQGISDTKAFRWQGRNAGISSK